MMPHKKVSNIMLVGGGVGNAVLLSIGKEFLKHGKKVLYFAGYKKLKDLFKRDLIEKAASTVVWTCDEGLIEIKRKKDRTYCGNVIDAIIAYQSGRLGNVTIDLGSIKKIITIGSSGMMKALNNARITVLKSYLQYGCEAIASVNSPMQCMMKGVCAQCLQLHTDGNFLYSCINQDQSINSIDFDFLDDRLKQNSLQEKLTVKWLSYVKR
ncbi:ferredoxin reductase domain-containing protein [Wolbachia endosymbiont of Pentidionis agamae]|uniref:oxidoreductase n=1 Tax=Wolbachia endosymbiont of Pentidionis agamae TaxID=3110435 RepID=UPI002FD66EB6